MLAGPTVALEGTMRIFRVKNMLAEETDSLHSQSNGNVDVLCDLPFRFGTDHAEGMALFPCFGEEALIIVYDTPDATRRPDNNSVFADIFKLAIP